MQKKLFVSALLFSITAFAAPVYFLVDQTQTPHYVIKPSDNGPTANAEALAYALAETLGLPHLTPETSLALIPFGMTQKLCSVQRYIPDMENLCELAQEWLNAGLTDEELLPLIDHSSFEELYLFILLLYDTDAHANNICALKDSSGVYHLIKIDNGLSFPEKNRGLFNALYLLPHSKKKFSSALLHLIENLPMDLLEEKFIELGMENSFSAFVERTALLKKLAPSHTMGQIDFIFYQEERPPHRQ